MSLPDFAMLCINIMWPTMIIIKICHIFYTIGESSNKKPVHKPTQTQWYNNTSYQLDDTYQPKK